MGWEALRCAVVGHAVDNRTGPQRRCRDCRARFLAPDGSATRVRHTLSCFLGRHRYQHTDTRDGHREYVCARCGHPLLFTVEGDPYAGSPTFSKRVRYLCGLTGHHVHVVGRRCGLTEYACGCGHPFLKKERGLSRIRHPAACVVAAHWIRYLETRGGYDEYLCGTCGHTFAFVSRRPARPARQASSRTKITPEAAISARASSAESSSRTVTVNGSPKNIRPLMLSMRAFTRT